MANREKIHFSNLKDVFSKEAPKSFTEEELLSVIRSPDSLVKKDKAEQLHILGAILRQMQISEKFRTIVLEEIDRPRQKPR